MLSFLFLSYGNCFHFQANYENNEHGIYYGSFMFKGLYCVHILYSYVYLKYLAPTINSSV